MKLIYKIQFKIVYFVSSKIHNCQKTAKIQIFLWDFLLTLGFFSKYLINFADDFDCSLVPRQKSKKRYNLKKLYNLNFVNNSLLFFSIFLDLPLGLLFCQKCPISIHVILMFLCSRKYLILITVVYIM